MTLSPTRLVDSIRSNDAPNTIPDKPRWHSVIVGRQPGVFFDSSRAVTENVKGVPGQLVLKFDTEDAARGCYADCLAEGKVVQVTITHIRNTMDPADELSFPGIQANNIVPDALKYYAVIIGRTPGIFPRGYNIQENTLYIPGALSETYQQYEDAVNAFRKALRSENVVKVVFDIDRKTLTPDVL